MKYIDISRMLYSGMKKYHSDPQVQIYPFKSLKKGDSCNLKKIVLGSHAGTHVDAPRHIFERGDSIERLNFHNLICDVYVVDVKNLTGEALLRKVDKRGVRGIVLKNAKSGLTIEASRILIKNRIKVVGIDQMSIEESLDKSHPVHRLLLNSGIIIVEDLDLRMAKTGHCKLLCLPLKIKNGDGAPARAVLIYD